VACTLLEEKEEVAIATYIYILQAECSWIYASALQIWNTVSHCMFVCKYFKYLLFALSVQKFVASLCYFVMISWRLEIELISSYLKYIQLSIEWVDLILQDLRLRQISTKRTIISHLNFTSNEQNVLPIYDHNTPLPNIYLIN
jgi:hypothetical protein